MEKIKFFEVKKVKIKDIKLDETNPNEMSKLKREGLKEVINKFGFLEPVIINQDNIMVDGEHRFVILKEQGEKEIPVIQINVKDVDRRMIRQTMNKLRGEHNPREDIEELIRISKDVSLQDMSRYLGLEEKNLGDYLESVNQVPESVLYLMAEEQRKIDKRRFITLKLTDEQAKKILDEMGDLNLKDVAFVPVGGILVDNIGKKG